MAELYCPRCGSPETKVVKGVALGGKEIYCMNPGCGLRTPYRFIGRSLEECIEWWNEPWNTRPEPNTRALDERVKELRDWLVMERKRYEHRNMFEHEQANENVIEKLKELFPAELKEKLESEDGN